MNLSTIDIDVYEGKLGKGEHRIATINGSLFPTLPQKNDLIAIGEEEDGMVYVVKQAMFDYTCNQYSLFVQLYDWE